MVEEILKIYKKEYQEEVVKEAIESVKEKYEQEDLSNLAADLNNYFVHIRNKMAKVIHRKQKLLNREDIDYLERDFFEIRPEYSHLRNDFKNNEELNEMMKEYHQVKQVMIEMCKEDARKMDELEKSRLIISNNSWLREGTFLKDLKNGKWNKEEFKKMKKAMKNYEEQRNIKPITKKQVFNIFRVINESVIKHYKEKEEFQIVNFKEKHNVKLNELMDIMQKVVI